MDSLPTLRFELSGLQHNVVHALLDSQAELTAYAKKVIEATLNDQTADRIAKQVATVTSDAVYAGLHRVLHDVVERELEKFFSEGPGKDMVVEALMKGLKLK